MIEIAISLPICVLCWRLPAMWMEARKARLASRLAHVEEVAKELSDAIEEILGNQIERFEGVDARVERLEMRIGLGGE